MGEHHGRVYLVGAGPGDPELITVRGLKLLRQAEVLIHDRLVAPELVTEAPSNARVIDVGKVPGRHRWSQRRINALLVAEARRGRRVIRLKGGDPFVFGRGGEECRALAAAGIRYEIVPGISSAIAAPAFAGIPVTHREHASAFTVVTGHPAGDEPDWARLSEASTLVILMGLGRLQQIVERLRTCGRAADTPVAVISRATTGDQTVVRGTLRDIARRTRRARLSTPSTIVIGEVAGIADSLAWFGQSSEETEVA